MFSRNVTHLRPAKTSVWRTIATGTWRITGDSSVYSIVEIPVENALAHIEKINSTNNTRLTITHLVAKALALTLKENPQINSIIRFGKIYERGQIDIFLQVAADKAGENLSGVTIRNMDQKTLVDVATELQQQATEIREKGDPSFKKVKSTVGAIPGVLVPFLIDTLGFILYSLNIWSPLLKVQKDPFGSAMVTNIGSLGADFALVPLVPYSRVPLLLSIGAITESPWVDPQTKQISVRRVVKFGVTFDHRIIDGVHGAKMGKSFKRFMENPELLDQPI